MKKGIVLEKHRKYSIILTNSGDFQKAKPIHHKEIGAEVVYEPFAKRKHSLSFFLPNIGKNMFFRVALLICMPVLIFMPFYFNYDGNKAYAYVNVDINPSIELEIDKTYSVNSIKALNEDAEAIVERVGNMKGKRIGQAISIIMNQTENDGFLDNGKNVLIGISYYGEELTENNPVETVVDSYLAEHESDWNVVTIQVPEEIREKAKQNEEPMNELMANDLAEEDNKDTGMTDEKNDLNELNKNNRIKANRVEKDRAKTEKPDKQPPAKLGKKADHPSELKKKNGESNSNKVNKRTTPSKNSRQIKKAEHQRESDKAITKENRKKDKHKQDDKRNQKRDKGKKNKHEQKNESTKKRGSNNKNRYKH